MTAPRVPVVSWRNSYFVDGWAFATLACGHRAEQKNRRRPKSKRCHSCWLAKRQGKPCWPMPKDPPQLEIVPDTEGEGS